MRPAFQCYCEVDQNECSFGKTMLLLHALANNFEMLKRLICSVPEFSDKYMYV